MNSRINPGFSELHFRAALEAIKDAFGETWLCGTKAHPIRDLWKRTDALASNELLWLGDSILKLKPIRLSWVEEAIDHIKSENRNERVGFVFEILALGSFANNNQVVRLPPRSNPDYDADIAASTGESYRLSLKNFGASTRENEFKKRCQEIEATVLSYQKTNGLSWMGLAVQANRFPTDADWRDLADGIVSAIQQGSPVRVGSCWEYIPTPQPTTAHGLSPDCQSFSIFVLAPHHANEKKNFLDKIERQCLEFNAAAKKYEPGISAVPLIRLSEAAPIGFYEEWATEYLERPDVRLDGIILYQSAVAVDLKSDTTGVHHYFKTIMKAGFSRPLPTILVASGFTPGTPSRSVIVINGHEVPLKENHWYQHREFYALAALAQDGTGEINMHSMPGSVTHAVVGNAGEPVVVFSPRQPTYSGLALFS